MAAVLVVDDDPDIRALVRLNLELDGHEVETASNGAEALELVEARPPDLMVVDLMMPRVDGFGVLEAVKAAGDEQVSRIPVLLLTAHDSPEQRVRGGIEGALRYLRKPFSASELRREVRDALVGDPEPVKRRRAQHAALEQLARMESGGDRPASSGVRPRITRLERPSRGEDVATPPEVRPPALDSLTDKQRLLVERLAASATGSVSQVAADLGMSRSNVYATLRRISRRLGLPSVPALLAMVRDGHLLDAPER